MTPDQLTTSQGVPYREVVVRLQPATGGPVALEAIAPDVLDAQREQAAGSLGSGHRVLISLAGSDKTP